MISWMKAIRKKPEMRKITVILPRELVETATRVSKLNLTATIRQGLEAVAATDAYEQLRKLRGKERFSISLKELRRD
jgi:post-segregation antitoxin (ccd killing protein)